MPPLGSRSSSSSKVDSMDKPIGEPYSDRPSPMESSVKGQKSRHIQQDISDTEEDEVKHVATGRWTDAEHNLFLEGLRRFPYRAWKNIATLIKTRTVVQIRTHAQKYYQKLQKEDLQKIDSADRCSEASYAPKNVPQRNSAAKKTNGAKGRKRKIEGQCNTRGKKLTKRVKLVFREPVDQLQASNDSLMAQSILNHELISDDGDASHELSDESDQFPMLESLPLIDENNMELTRSTPADDLIFLQLCGSDDDDVSDLSDDGNFGWLAGTDDEHDSLSSVFSSPTSPFSEFSSSDPSSPTSICLSPLYTKTEAEGERSDFLPILSEDPLLDPDIFVTDFFTNS